MFCLLDWARDLFPLGRSLTGEGVRETLAYIKNELPDLRLHQVSTGTKTFDWEVPQEWCVREAYLEHEIWTKVR